MRGRLLLSLSAAAGAVILAAAAPAAAQDPYPPTEPALTVSDTTVVVGATVTIQGSGFVPGAGIEIDTETTPFAAPAPAGGSGGDQIIMAISPVTQVVPIVASQPDTSAARAGDDGTFTAQLRMTEVGRTVITATGQEAGRTASAVVTVTAAGDQLPETGSSTLPLAQIGAVVVVSGAVLLAGSLLWRRRGSRVE